MTARPRPDYSDARAAADPDAERARPTSTPPLKFALTTFVRPDAYPDARYRSGDAAEALSDDLIRRLFDEQFALRELVESGLDLALDPQRMRRFDPEGRFDHAVCLLHLDRLGETPWRQRTQLYRHGRLVTLVERTGRLVAP